MLQRSKEGYDENFRPTACFSTKFMETVDTMVGVTNFDMVGKKLEEIASKVKRRI